MRLLVACPAVMFMVGITATSAMAESVSTQELSGALGLEMGVGGNTPGGVRLAGSHLYQLSAHDWLASEIAVTYGNPGADCAATAGEDLDCDHGLLDGVAVLLGSGIRHYFASQGAFSPYVRGGLGLKLVGFPSDDVSGVGVVLIAGGGIRAEVADGVAVIGGAAIEGGMALLNRDLGGEPELSLVVQGGAEFSL